SLACSYCLFERAMRRNDRSVGAPSRQSVEHFREARVVRITPEGFAIWLDPFGMLDPQIVVNLLPELGVGVDLMIHGYCPGERFKCEAGLFGHEVRRSRRCALAV